MREPVAPINERHPNVRFERVDAPRARRDSVGAYSVVLPVTFYLNPEWGMSWCAARRLSDDAGDRAMAIVVAAGLAASSVVPLETVERKTGVSIGVMLGTGASTMERLGRTLSLNLLSIVAQGKAFTSFADLLLHEDPAIRMAAMFASAEAV